jgi:hypothetical protein
VGHGLFRLVLLLCVAQKPRISSQGRQLGLGRQRPMPVPDTSPGLPRGPSVFLTLSRLYHKKLHFSILYKKGHAVCTSSSPCRAQLYIMS